MSTADKLVNIYLKKFLPQQQMKENFLEFLLKQQKDNLALMYPGQGFFFGNSMSGSGPDEITLTTPSLATDGLANLLQLDPSEAAAKFENALGVPYYVGLRYNSIEDDTEINVRTGQIEYVFFKDAIGEKGEPDAITDNGTTLTLDVDAVTELGVTNAGRKVTVYLKRALSRAEAFYVGEVEFVAGKNVVNTTHLLGQTAGLVSLDPSDYVVFIHGPTIRRNTDLRLDPNIAFVGIVTGVGAGNTPGPGDIDTSDSIVLYTGGAISPTIDSLRAFFVGGGDITWDLDTGTVTWAEDFKWVLTSRPFDFTIAADSFAGLADGEALYFIRDEVGGIKTLAKAPITDIVHSPYYEPLIFRYGDDILFRNGVLELKGEVGDTTVGRIDGITQDLLNFIGALNESDGSPNYSTAVAGGPYSNQHVINGESLLRAIKRLDLRDDIVNKVDAVDLVRSVLPATASVVVDGLTLVNGNKVLFTNAALNGIYEVAGIGVAATWTKLHAFDGSQTPQPMSLVGVKNGSSEHLRNVFYYDQTNFWNPLDTSKLEMEPTGFPNRDDSEISFDNGTRTFTIQPKAPATRFDYAIKGKFFRKETAQTVVITDTEGLHFIFFDGETLVSSQVYSDDIILARAFVATVSWDVANQEAIILGEERHALTMDGPTHAYLHNTLGTRYVSGLGLTFNDAGDGSLDAHAQVAVGDGLIYDEDLDHNIVDDPAPTDPFEQILDPIAEIPVYYRDGVNGDWRKDTATTFPVKQGAARIQYNDPAGPWTQVDASLDGNFVAMWLFATNNIFEPIIALLGQREDTTLELAQQNNLYETFQFGELLSLEMKVLYRLIFQTDSAYTNTPNAKLVDVRDLKKSIDVALGAFTPSSHNALSGRNATNSHPASAISTDTSLFNTALTSFDDQVQKALATLGLHLGQMRIQEHATVKTRVVISPATLTLNTGNKLRLQQNNLTVKFDGAVIDTTTGEVFEADGTTPLGVDYAPIIPALNQWRWFAVSLVATTVNPDNTINSQLSVVAASADGATQDAAPRATFGLGLKIGQFAIQENGSGGIADILNGNFEQQGPGGSADAPVTATTGDGLIEGLIAGENFVPTTPIAVYPKVKKTLTPTPTAYVLATSLGTITLAQTKHTYPYTTLKTEMETKLNALGQGTWTVLLSEQHFKISNGDQTFTIDKLVANSCTTLLGFVSVDTSIANLYFRADSLHQFAKEVQLFAVNTSDDPSPPYIDDGLFLTQVPANHRARSFSGFVYENAAQGALCDLKYEGDLAGFAGLTLGGTYHTNGTAGEVSTSTVANSLEVGQPKSPTTLVLDPVVRGFDYQVEPDTDAEPDTADLSPDIEWAELAEYPTPAEQNVVLKGIDANGIYVVTAQVTGEVGARLQVGFSTNRGDVFKAATFAGSPIGPASANTAAWDQNEFHTISPAVSVDDRGLVTIVYPYFDNVSSSIQLRAVYGSITSDGVLDLQVSNEYQSSPYVASISPTTGTSDRLQPRIFKKGSEVVVYAIDEAQESYVYKSRDGGFSFTAELNVKSGASSVVPFVPNSDSFSPSHLIMTEVPGQTIADTDLLSNGDFETLDLTDWTDISAAAGAVTVGAEAKAAFFNPGIAAQGSGLQQDFATVAGRSYRILLNLTEFQTSNNGEFKLTARETDGTIIEQTLRKSDGLVELVFTAVDTMSRVQIEFDADTSAGSFKVDNVSVVNVAINRVVVVYNPVATDPIFSGNYHAALAYTDNADLSANWATGVDLGDFSAAGYWNLLIGLAQCSETEWALHIIQGHGTTTSDGSVVPPVAGPRNESHVKILDFSAAPTVSESGEVTWTGDIFYTNGDDNDDTLGRAFIQSPGNIMSINPGELILAITNDGVNGELAFIPDFTNIPAAALLEAEPNAYQVVSELQVSRFGTFYLFALMKQHNTGTDPLTEGTISARRFVIDPAFEWVAEGKLDIINKPNSDEQGFAGRIKALVAVSGAIVLGEKEVTVDDTADRENLVFNRFGFRETQVVSKWADFPIETVDNTPADVVAHAEAISPDGTKRIKVQLRNGVSNAVFYQFSEDGGQSWVADSFAVTSASLNNTSDYLYRNPVCWISNDGDVFIGYLDQVATWELHGKYGTISLGVLSLNDSNGGNGIFVTADNHEFPEIAYNQGRIFICARNNSTGQVRIAVSDDVGATFTDGNGNASDASAVYIKATAAAIVARVDSNYKLIAFDHPSNPGDSVVLLLYTRSGGGDVFGAYTSDQNLANNWSAEFSFVGSGGAGSDMLLGYAISDDGSYLAGIVQNGNTTDDVYFQSVDLTTLPLVGDHGAGAGIEINSTNLNVDRANGYTSALADGAAYRHSHNKVIWTSAQSVLIALSLNNTDTASECYIIKIPNIAAPGTNTATQAFDGDSVNRLTETQLAKLSDNYFLVAKYVDQDIANWLARGVVVQKRITDATPTTNVAPVIEFGSSTTFGAKSYLGTNAIATMSGRIHVLNSTLGPEVSFEEDNAGGFEGVFANEFKSRSLNEYLEHWLSVAPQVSLAATDVTLAGIVRNGDEILVFYTRATSSVLQVRYSSDAGKNWVNIDSVTMTGFTPNNTGDFYRLFLSGHYTGSIFFYLYNLDTGSDEIRARRKTGAFTFAAAADAVFGPGANPYYQAQVVGTRLGITYAIAAIGTAENGVFGYSSDNGDNWTTNILIKSGVTDADIYSEYPIGGGVCDDGAAGNRLWFIGTDVSDSELKFFYTNDDGATFQTAIQLSTAIANAGLWGYKQFGNKLAVVFYDAGNTDALYLTVCEDITVATPVFSAPVDISDGVGDIDVFNGYSASNTSLRGNTRTLSRVQWRDAASLAVSYDRKDNGASGQFDSVVAFVPDVSSIVATSVVAFKGVTAGKQYTEGQLVKSSLGKIFLVSKEHTGAGGDNLDRGRIVSKQVNDNNTFGVEEDVAFKTNDVTGGFAGQVLAVADGTILFQKEDGSSVEQLYINHLDAKPV